MINKIVTDAQKLLTLMSIYFCSVIVGEPITVPKIENPTEEIVDLYHEMYIKSLQCLFDKYKTRFGLKESDVLHIQ